MTSQRTSVDIPIQPWFADHSFNGKTVFPAVETMLLLGKQISKLFPQTDIRVMENVSFGKLLEIPPGCIHISGLIEYEKHENGLIAAKLLTRVQAKTLTRLKQHGEVFFPSATISKYTSTEENLKPKGDPLVEVPAEKVYRELVPFGPSYHTLQETLYLSEKNAWGKLLAPTMPVSASVLKILGSPFPLDGAFHAACVLGQQFADFVPFPVALSRRSILQPTEPGGKYFTKVSLTARSDQEMIFDLTIFDEDSQVCEIVNGIRMRDVSAGRIKPPEWIRKRDTGEN